MNTLAVLAIGYLLSRWGRGSSPTPSPAPPSTASPPSGGGYGFASTQPWPQVPASDLPRFPGAGWVPDVPVGPGVAARASQLLRTLWGRGEGSSVVEQTAGRWIAYQAAMTSGKRGVVAYRHVEDNAPVNVPEPVTVVTDVPVANAPQTTLRTLRIGATGGDVVAVQKIVGVTPDGKYGPKTAAAVSAWQNSKGLVADGIVGPKTFAKMFGGQV